MDQTRHGCRIQSRVCSCGFGCKSEYRYLTMKDCQDALKGDYRSLVQRVIMSICNNNDLPVFEGKRTDVCFNQPCMNGGSCIQISQFPGYRCRCEGTGYYGQRCHISKWHNAHWGYGHNILLFYVYTGCPLPGAHVRGVYPYECIVIWSVKVQLVLIPHHVTYNKQQFHYCQHKVSFSYYHVIKWIFFTTSLYLISNSTVSIYWNSFIW